MQQTRPQSSRFSRAVAGFVGYLVQTRSRALATLLVGLLAALGAAWFGSGIPIDTDLKSLLPPEAPTVLALDTLKQRKGSGELFTLAVEEADPTQRQAMIDGLAEEVEGWPETRALYRQRDYTPLRNHALYFLELDELENLRDTFVRERKEAVARSMAKGVGFGDGEIDVAQIEVGEDDWDADFDEEDEDDGGEPEPAAEGSGDEEEKDLAEWLQERRDSIAGDGKLTKKEIDLIWVEENEKGEIEWEEEVGDLYLSKNGTVQVIKASLENPPTDVEFAQQMTARIEARVAELKGQGIAPEAKVQVVAAYNVSNNVDTVLRDAKRATAVSLLLVMVVLVVGLRSARSLALVVVPLAVATGFTLAAARILVSELNALTIFMFAVLFGMGVDFAVHLFALRRSRPDRSWPDIVEGHLRPLASSMLTTAGSLLALQLADFKAFQEFGLISAVGVFACFCCAVVFVPVIDSLFPPLKARPQAPAAPPTGRGPSPLRWGLLAAVVAVAAIGAPKVAFEKDLRNVNSRPPEGQKISYGSATGRCSKFTTLLAEDPAALDAAVAALAEERDEKRMLPGRPEIPDQKAKPWVRGVFSVSTIMPTEQSGKHVVIGEVRQQANDFLAELPDLDDEARKHRTHLEALEKLASADPLEPAELPAWARQPFVEQDGRDDLLAHLCLKIRSNHLDELVAVANRLDELVEDDVMIADSRLVFAEVVTNVEADGRRLPMIALGVILFFIALDLRRPVPTLAVFGALLLGLSLAMAVMGLVPIKTNFFNLVVLPAVLGVSIDTGIHLWHSRSRTSYQATGRATIVSAMTTMAGFAGLLVADHPGMHSIGELGVAAIAACVGVIFVALYPGARR